MGCPQPRSALWGAPDRPARWDEKRCEREEVGRSSGSSLAATPALVHAVGCSRACWCFAPCQSVPLRPTSTSPRRPLCADRPTHAAGPTEPGSRAPEACWLFTWSVKPLAKPPQGLTTKVVQAAAHALGQLLPREQRPSLLPFIRTAPTSSSSLPHTGMSAASTTSEAATAAVQVSRAPRVTEDAPYGWRAQGGSHPRRRGAPSC
jgi:hypothetical protein